MIIKIFVPNEFGRIELTKEELEKLLNESYQQGWNDKPNYYYNQPYYTLCSNTADASYTTSTTTIDNLTASGVNTRIEQIDDEIKNAFKVELK
jgi:hypothetical protein